MSACMIAIGSLYAAGAQNGQGRWAIIVFIYVSTPITGNPYVCTNLHVLSSSLLRKSTLVIRRLHLANTLYYRFSTTWAVSIKVCSYYVVSPIRLALTSPLSDFHNRNPTDARPSHGFLPRPQLQLAREPCRRAHDSSLLIS